MARWGWELPSPLPQHTSSLSRLLQLQGLERTDFQNESFGTERTDLGRLDQFLSVCRTLPGSNKRLEPGQYEWSFVLGLPEDARSTFRLMHGVEGKKSFRW